MIELVQCLHGVQLFFYFTGPHIQLYFRRHQSNIIQFVFVLIAVPTEYIIHHNNLSIVQSNLQIGALLRYRFK